MTTLDRCHVTEINPVELIVYLQSAFGGNGDDIRDMHSKFLLKGEYGLQLFFDTIIAPVLDHMLIEHENYSSHLAAVQVICSALAKLMHNIQVCVWVCRVSV